MNLNDAKKIIQKIYNPSKGNINKIRKSKFRPEVMMFFINPDKKCLFVHYKKYDIWGVPQGGIDAGETVVDAIPRETIEELGKHFFNKIDNCKYLGTHKLHISTMKNSDDPDKNNKLGKYFYIYAIFVNDINKINKSEFDKFIWGTYSDIIKKLTVNTVNSDAENKINLFKKYLNKLKKRDMIK
jgi:8-oxo-dGTP pyrophosphatase MutT (NUDIX family)